MTSAKRFLKRLYQNGSTLQVWSLSVTLPTFAKQMSKWWYLNILGLIGHIFVTRRIFQNLFDVSM